LQREGIIAAVTEGGDVLLWDPRTKSKGGLVNLTDEPPVGEVVYNYRTITIDEVDPEAKQGSSWWPWGPPKTKFVNAVCGSGHVVNTDFLSFLDRYGCSNTPNPIGLA